MDTFSPREAARASTAQIVTAAGIEIHTLTGPGADPGAYLEDLARLRIAVFREFPYLYDGTIEYETRYLRTYSECAESVIVLAVDDGRVVGASTGLPLAAETDEVRQPFVKAGLDLARIFYCGESVLLPAYRGQGLYRKFFAIRERHARILEGFERIVFCGVQRPADHPSRPPGYEPLDGVWRHFGYQPREDLVAHFRWKDIGEARTSAKPLTFWEKML